MERVVHKAIKNYDFISTCYHEAGHTVIALLKAFRVTEVKVCSKNSGETYYTRPSFSNNKSRNKTIAVGEVSVLYSGIESEKILFQTLDSHNIIPRSIKNGSSSDFKSALWFIRKYDLAEPGKETTQFKSKIRSKLKNKIVRHWEDITLISNALIKNKKIKYNRIKKILLTYSPNHLMWEKKFLRIENKFNSYE